MPPEPIIDLNAIDPDIVIADTDAIQAVNPQRYEMAQLDAVVYLDTDAGVCVGYKNIGDKEFWVRGHIPGRPLFPGVLMIEAAAQLASYYTHAVLENTRFMGFGGVDGVKFRGTVTPGQRLILVGKSLDVRPRRSVCYVQGFVDKTMVFEATITGMPV